MAETNAATTTMSFDELQRTRKLKRISDMQLSPVKALPMTMLMLWMVGSDIHIFSIYFVANAISAPVQQIMNTGKTFSFFDGDNTISAEVFRGKIIYTLCCLVALCVGFVKLSWMGLLPTGQADWMDHSRPRLSETSFLMK